MVEGDAITGKNSNSLWVRSRAKISNFREYDDDDHYGSYGYRNSYYPPQPYYLPPPLRDRKSFWIQLSRSQQRRQRSEYVCDLDASVLLAMDGHSYGYNKAIRVR